MLLTDRRADALLVGAADEWAFDYHHAYERLGVTRSPGRPGFALAEGASLVLLEREEDALARGARIRARLASVVTRTARVAPYARRATPALLAEGMRAALDEAGVAPAGVALVSLSADGVPWTDEAEQVALRDVFGEAPPPTVAIKLQIGENPCSGAAQIALAAYEISEGDVRGPVLLCAMGAGGNFYWAVLTPV
jgi:3-oxoacyl-[acyl-carrier-protein] synthase II